MPADDSAGERTEEPTARRLQKERDRGQVAKSQDLNASVVMLAGMLFLRFAGDWIFRYLFLAAQGLIGQTLGSEPAPYRLEILSYLTQWGMWVALALAPFLLTVATAALIINVAQAGFLFSTEALMPDLSKLNPVNGMKKLVSLRGLMTLAMNSGKLVAVGIVAYLFIRAELPAAMNLMYADPAQILTLAGMAVINLALYLAVIFFLLGIIDYIYQRYQYMKDLKMTKQEVKEEAKDVEGDPQVKSKRRQIQMQLAQQRMMQEVPQAEVVVRNPTHFAVAIRYKPDMAAPEIVAKGVDRMAQRIIRLAIDNNVPCWQAPSLARQLYRIEVGDTVPPALFPAVAEVLAHVLRGEKLAEYEQAMNDQAA